ncbi:MAG: hypothetical protein EGP82_02095 [Odoribacter splanchnicus]|nr:hypothetical protein [Odoribacter splanchnicus]
MKIDFRKIEVTDIEGKKHPMDLSKALGNLLYENTGDIGEMDLAREIYYKGEVDLPTDIQSIINIISAAKIKAFLKVALLNTLTPKTNGTD